MKTQTLSHEIELENLKDQTPDLRAQNVFLNAKINWFESENARLHAENAALAVQVQELEGQIEALKARVLKLTQQVYGRKSEQQPPKDNDSGDDNSSQQSQNSSHRRGQQPGARGHGRRKYHNLPEREEIHDVPETSRHCPYCGLPYDPFPPGDEVSEEIDWQVEVKRVVHIRKSYHKTCQCSGAPVIITAPPPSKVIPKGLFTAEFIARLIIEKYVLGRPLSRIGAAMRMEGLDLAQGTLVGVLRRVSFLLTPLYNAICAHCLSAGLWQADETGWKVFEDVEGKSSNRWWLWAFASSDTIVFIMDPSRSATVPKKFFGLTGEDPNPARGLLGSDFYRVYQSLGEGIVSFFCWAHMRRHFLDAARGYSKLQGWTDEWCDIIATLYQLYNVRKKLSPGTQGYLEADNKLRCFVKDEIEATWRTQLTDSTIPLAGRDVLKTMQRHWEGLTRFLDNPLLPLDNNFMERMLRTPVVGRKNFYGSGSRWSGEFAATIWTITATVSRANINPLSYLVDVLTACAHSGGKPLEGLDLDRFLPWMMSRADSNTWDISRNP